MTFVIDTTVRVSIILLIALGAALVLRHRSAAVRHWVLAFGVVCGAITPLLELTLPSWHIAVPAFSSAPPGTASASSVTTSFIVSAGPDAGNPSAARTANTLTASRSTGASGNLLLGVWITGVCVSASMLLVGLWRLARLTATARRVDGGRWGESVAQIARDYGLRRRVVILQSDHPSLLVTWGFTAPKLVLPAAAHEWPHDRVRIVVRHELAHVRRGDWLAQMCAELLRAVYWFNPLTWVVCRRLRQESEHACDDAVLNGGVEATDYASHLVELARSFTAMRRAPGPALAMARPSSLEGRISAMLNEQLNRRPPTRTARFAIAVALVALTLPIALAAQNRFATFSGTVVDQTNSVLPDVTLTLTNPSTRAKYEVHTDRTGHFEFVGLAVGDYTVATSQVGFEPFTDTLSITGSNISRTIQLAVGHLQETITMTAGSTAQPNPYRDQMRIAARASADQRLQKIRARCASADQPTGVGGNIAAPLKLVDVKPVYPEQLQAAKIGGVVKLDALIGTDGTVRDVKVVDSANPDLERAAIDAVRQWEFTPTYLNCTPIEVRMQVLASFVGDR